MKTLVLLRHGQSAWNLSNQFTGWTDVPLSDKGREEARQAGLDLAKAGILPDFCFTSFLRRAIDTLHIALSAMNREWLPEIKDWHLNERHYGALQGLNKAKTAEKYGDEQVHIWRRSFDVQPPALTPDDDRNPARDPRYSGLDRDDLPLTESLKDTIKRVGACWSELIAPHIALYDTVIVAAHGNSLRALAKKLLHIDDKEIVKLEIPTGRPWIFELDDNLNVLKNYYL